MKTLMTIPARCFRTVSGVAAVTKREKISPIVMFSLASGRDGSLSGVVLTDGSPEVEVLGVGV
ncbi:hypothetical protein MSTE_04510 [Mycobacteroides stephanolepidis]|uniref:Uncharacterized protein n=1 Tax=[Mycobacterium] stephanolepidis TaxID=1520670 RepID=A0A1Z4F3P2_9MYCO|nr:hypothetical protein MSTE_04510 [[Mycobacterium] stephanolepidis]